MYFRGLGTATPTQRYSQVDCLDAFEKSDWFDQLDARAHWVARSVLRHDNGIAARWLALDTLAEAFTIDPDTLARRFESHAPALAAQAGARALDDAGLLPAQIDAVVVSTCTGRLCPGLSGHLVERLGMRTDVLCFDLVGQGCAAALPNCQLGQALLGAGVANHVLSVCVELSSAAMYLDNDPGVLISACLFGDGAGAAVLSHSPQAGRRDIKWTDSASLIEPSQRQALRFEQRGGLQRNILTRAVPALAATHAHRVLGKVLWQAGLNPDDIRAWILHAGGRDVLLALARRFELDDQALRYSAAMLLEYGNLSSAFVYFVLQAALADNAPPGWWWLSSFGAGFSCHGALLQVS